MRLREMPPILKPGAFCYYICAWCRRPIGKRKHDPEAVCDYVSHGICKRCAKIHFNHTAR